MAYSGPVRRWDVYWADLEPGVGHEQKGAQRPVIVVSNDGFNRSFRMVTVVPATKHEGKQRNVYGFEVLLPKGTLTPDHASIAMPHQIRSISSLRLLEKIGTLHDAQHQAAIENRLLEHLGIAFEAEEIG
jgi:mRNA-degrading endonuclease toxin of MazEF toxin-antitoxin module